MKPLFRLFVAALLIAAIPMSGASAAPDRTGTAAKGTPFEWDGTVATGTGFGNFLPAEVPAPRECSKEVTFYCDTTLVGVELSLTEDEVTAGMTRKRGQVEIKIDSPTVAAYDFDLKVFESDANGVKGAELASVGDLDETPGEEAATISVQGTVAEPIDYYIVEVIYFYAVQGNYKGHATVLGTPRAS